MLLTNLFGLAAAATSVMGASLQQVKEFGNNPTKIYMYIYVPDKLAAKPAVIVAVRIPPIQNPRICFVSC
jgi:acetylxylan esterase